MRPTKPKSKQATAWEVTQFRLTVFTNAPYLFTMEDWEEIAGVEPAEFSVRPHVKVASPYERGVLVGQAAAGRLDVRYAPAPPSGELVGDPLATLGAVETGWPEFLDAAKKLLSKVPDVYRLALGLILLQRADDVPTAHKTLLKYLPDLKLKSGADFTDLFFQINRPRLGKTKGYPRGQIVNRVSKWSVARWMSATIAVGEGTTRQIAAPFATTVGLELDLNSAAEITAPFKSGVPVALLNELYSLGKEIIEKGAIA